MVASSTGDGLYRDLAQLTGDVYWVVRTHPDEALEFISGEIADIAGHTAEELSSTGPELIMTVVDPRDVSALMSALDIPVGESGYAELRFRHATGRIVFAQMWFRRRMRADGSLVVEGVTREVTTLHRLESALRESEDRFRNAMRSSAVGMCLVSPSGAFLEVNSALCELLGRDEADLRRISWQTLTHPDDLDVDLGLVAEVLSGARENYRLQKRFIRPNGQVVHGDMSVACVRDEDGQVRYFVTQIIDMTRERQIEAERRASEAQYRLLVEESSDFLMRTVGTTGVIDWVTPSLTRTVGWTPQQVIGRQALDFLHPAEWPDAAERRRLMDSGQRVTSRHRVLCADGSHKWLEHIGRALFDDDGVLIGRISSFRDIDAQVRAEEALAASRAQAHEERERLRATMNAMLDPHFLIAPVRDADGTIVDFEHVDANEAALEHAGFTRDEFIGSRLLEMVPGQDKAFDSYVNAFEHDEPMIEDAMPFTDPRNPATTRLFDLRAVRVGDALSVTVRDATDRVAAAAELEQSQQRYRLLAENASDVVFRIHIDGTIEWLSEGVTGILGIAPDAFLNRHIDEFVYEPDQDALDAAVEEALVNGRATVRFRVTEPGGDLHWMEATLHPFSIGPGEETVLVGGCRDVHAEMLAIAELDRRARTDHLTELLNRDEAMTRLRMLSENSDGPVAVAFLDIDNFKMINDRHGHAVGDEWLRETASRIRAGLREGDLAARMGGDEILVAMPGLDSLQAASRRCEQLRALFDTDDALSSVSIGVTLAQPAEDIDRVIARADRAMYRAKEGGRNRVVGA